VNIWWNNIIGSWTYYSLSEHGRKPNSNHKSYNKAQTCRVCYVDVGLFSTRNWLHPIYQLKGSSWILPKSRGLWIFHRPQIVNLLCSSGDIFLPWDNGFTLPIVDLK
jgi:hypothetical protein